MKKPTGSAVVVMHPYAGKRILGTYVQFHIQALKQSLEQIYRAPMSTLMTMVAMGITLALPTALEAVVKQIYSWSQGVERSAEMTLYLKPGTSEARANQLVREMRQWPQIKQVHYISAKQALLEFKQATDLGDVLEILEQNPLSAQIRLEPKLGLHEAAGIQSLMAKIAQHADIELSETDLTWLQRLDAIIELGWRLLLVLTVLLGGGVVIICANSIRLVIQKHNENVAVTKFLGATHAFIRRPFLYTGIWFGLGSGIVAWLCVYLSILFIQFPARQIALLFAQDFELLQYGVTAMKIIPIACVLGWIGARIGAGRYLASLDRSAEAFRVTY